MREQAQQPTISRGPPPSMKEQTNSIANLASKFVDNEEDEASDDDDTSSFEQVAKPIDRSDKKNPQADKPQETSETATISKALSVPPPSEDQELTPSRPEAPQREHSSPIPPFAQFSVSPLSLFFNPAQNLTSKKITRTSPSPSQQQ